MLSYIESSFAVGLALMAAFLLVAILNRFWPIKNRKLINDVTGWQLGILGTTYGVILGFMLYTVWGDFHVAEVNTNMEASSLLTVSRIALGLPMPERQQFHALAVKYAEAVTAEEWPAMERQEESHASEAVAANMWLLLGNVQAEGSAGDNNSVDHLTSALSDLSERRNLREEEVNVKLPNMLWVLLLAGAVATVGSACLLGHENKWLHYIQVLALTFVVAVALAAIADLARPFGGGVSVRPTAFERAQLMMQQHN
jgi:hypothetical protein